MEQHTRIVERDLGHDNSDNVLTGCDMLHCYIPLGGRIIGGQLWSQCGDDGRQEPGHGEQHIIVTRSSGGSGQ